MTMRFPVPSTIPPWTVTNYSFTTPAILPAEKPSNAGSISYHPSGIPHGPHPGAYKNSIGLKQTNEQAVMVDTFAPLCLTRQSEALEDPDYPTSWQENQS